MKITQNPVYYGAIASQKKNYRFKVGVIAGKISDYSDIKELDRATLHCLVKRIDVDEQIDDDGNRDITIEIYFNFKNLPVAQRVGPRTDLECAERTVTVCSSDRDNTSITGAGFNTCAAGRKKAG